MKTLPGVNRNIETIVLICFFLSGISGLIYQILWTRMIVKVIGGAPFAVSIILTVFMGGLGLGAYLASKNIDRIKETGKLLRMYGILELIIGVYAGAIPILLKVFLPLYSILYNQLYHHDIIYNLLTFIGVSIILCLPVVCMGATLPILCQFYVTSLSHLGTHTGRLYGLNTIGAAVGALICGFWLIDLLGVTYTLMLAVGINSGVGLLCLRVSQKISATISAPAEQSKVTGKAGPGKAASKSAAKKAVAATKPVLSDETETASMQTSSVVLIGALVIFAVSGFCAMAYEVIWTKLLGLIVGPTTYSFTIVLIAFILNLALGSMIFGWLADRVKAPIWLLINTQVASAIFVLLVSQLFGNSQLFFAKLIFSFKDSFALLNLFKAIILFCFMILPTLCLGATFPLVGKIYTQSVALVGKSLGFAYMINTLGAVLGSFLAGFVLIPLMGKEKSLSLVIGMQLLVPLIVAVMIIIREKAYQWKMGVVVAAALAGLLLCIHYPVWDRYGLSQGKYHRFESFKKIMESYGWWDTLFHERDIIDQSNLSKSKLVYYGDGIGGFTTVMESSEPLGRVHYGLINSGKPDASSKQDMPTQTMSAHFPMLMHPNPRKVMVLGLASGVTPGEVLYYPVDKLDILEISREVVTASDLFRPWNNHVLSHPKTNLIIQDGRAHLQLTNEKYDVIISEPSNPWMAGLATLFTQDFFLLAKDRLNRDGIFAQFIHSYQMDWPTFALVGRTFAEVFPNSLLITTNFRGDFLLIGFKGQNHLPRLQKTNPAMVYARQSKNMTLQDSQLLYGIVVSEDLPRLFGPGQIHSDARPRLEYAAPKSLYYSDPQIEANLQMNAWVSPETERETIRINESIDQKIDLFAYFLSVHVILDDMDCPAGANPVQKERFYKLTDDYCAHNLVMPPFKSIDLRQRCKAVQIDTIETHIDQMPDKAVSYAHLARLYESNKNWEKAANFYSKSLQIKPDDASVHEALANNLRRQGQIRESIAGYRKALLLNPDLGGALNSLGWILATIGDPKVRNSREAVQLAERACKLTNYKNPYTLDTLGAAYAAGGRFSDATDAVEKALHLMRESEGKAARLEAMQDRLRLYQSGKMYVKPDLDIP